MATCRRAVACSILIAAARAFSPQTGHCSLSSVLSQRPCASHYNAAASAARASVAMAAKKRVRKRDSDQVNWTAAQSSTKVLSS
jgi:hypothetical protein